MRTLPELLNRYAPDPDTRDILLSATEYSVQADKEHRAIFRSCSARRSASVSWRAAFSATIHTGWRTTA